MEHWWNEIDREKAKYSGKNLSQCHFVHNKSKMTNPVLRGERPATNRLSQCTATAYPYRVFMTVISISCRMT
jgi:hypothetical protein